MNKSKFYRKLTEAISNGISNAISDDDLFDDESALYPIEDVEDTSVYVSHSKLRQKLLEFDIPNRCKDSHLEVTLVCSDGNRFVIDKDLSNVDNANDIRFITFSAMRVVRSKNGHIYPGTRKVSVTICKDWFENFRKINEENDGIVWQSSMDLLPVRYYKPSYSKIAEQMFNGSETARMLTEETDNVIEKELSSKHIALSEYLPAITVTHACSDMLGDREIQCYLPAMGELVFLMRNLDIVNDMLSIIKAERLPLNEYEWWSSNECYSAYSAWGLNKGKMAQLSKGFERLALPLSDLKNEEN